MPTTNKFSAPTPRKSSPPNRFIAALAERCRQEPLREKWLLAPSYRVGQQWLDAVARAGQPLVNVHLKTLPTLALELAVSEQRLISPLGRAVLLGRALHQMRDGYLGALPASLAFAERLAATVHDLRLAGLETGDLERGQFEAAQKGRELVELMRGYHAALKTHRLADEADLLQRASHALDPQTLLLIPEDLELARLEHLLLEKVPAAQRVILPVDTASPGNVPDTFCAVGERNEVREVLRRCLTNGWPLDQVELISTDPGIYNALVYELTENLPAHDAVTFADGIPVFYARPGRALAGWLAWRRNDFPQATLVALLQDKLLETPDARLATALRAVPIGFGSDRYRTQLDAHIAGLERRQSASVAVARTLRTWLDPLLRLDSSNLLDAAATFLRVHARCVSEFDNYARQVLLDRIAELAGWLQPEDTFLNTADWLESLVRETRVLGLGPRPGCLHVSSVRVGGHTGRPHTFIVGLDNGRFPPAGGQDPVLLDDERHTLSAHLPTSGQHRERAVREFERLLARLRGHVILSYSSRSLADDAETFPSNAIPVVNATAGFAPTHDTGCLDESEWWLWRLCAAVPVANAAALVAGRFPHLGRGAEAQAAREGEAFGAFDGFVPDAGPVLDVAGPVSPSRLQTLGACPRRFFYKYALGAELPEELAIDPERWLPATEFGHLLHEVFHRFLRDGGKMPAILAEGIAHYREKFPPPSEGVFRRECRQLERATRIFLAEPDMQRPPLALEKQIENVPVTLADGSVLRVGGRIDRVDEVGGALVLWDYKTGSSSPFARTGKDPFDQGRVLQHALYLAMAEAHFGKRAAQFGYFFTSDKGRGDKLVFTPDRLRGLPAVLARLRALIECGVFPATDDTKDCMFCDYRQVCGDVEAVAAASERKLESPANTVLEPFRELRGYE